MFRPTYHRLVNVLFITYLRKQTTIGHGAKDMLRLNRKMLAENASQRIIHTIKPTRAFI